MEYILQLQALRRTCRTMPSSNLHCTRPTRIPRARPRCIPPARARKPRRLYNSYPLHHLAADRGLLPPPYLLVTCVGGRLTGSSDATASASQVSRRLRSLIPPPTSPLFTSLSCLCSSDLAGWSDPRRRVRRAGLIPCVLALLGPKISPIRTLV